MALFVLAQGPLHLHIIWHRGSLRLTAEGVYPMGSVDGVREKVGGFDCGVCHLGGAAGGLLRSHPPLQKKPPQDLT